MEGVFYYIMAQQISKFDINPSTGKQYGVNPNTGVQDDNYWAQQVDPVVNKDYIAQQHTDQQAAQAKSDYQAGIGSAVSSLQTQGTNLDTQYSDLLGKVMGVGTVAMNTATTGENNLLASRGIVNNSPLYSAQMTSAQLPVTTAVQGQIGSLGYTQAQLKNTLANNIASIQAGGAGTMAGLPLSYGSLALSSAANLANIAQAGSTALATGVGAHLISVPGFGLYNVDTGQFQQSYGTTGTPGTVNGVGGLWIP
jgi:hypothetical protein